ncbi:MAG: bifunctional lysylphosphatidylglycerol flippase/synthetase MprF [Verrucomicrobiota bacterium]
MKIRRKPSLRKTAALWTRPFESVHFAAYERWVAGFVPLVLGLATFLSGCVLLLSGALPATGGGSGLLARYDALPAFELSHFLGSLVGVLLLFLGRALQQRLDAGYWSAVVLLPAGLVLSLLRGGGWFEPVLLAGVLLFLLPCRKQFYRKASFWHARFTSGWITAVAIVTLGTIWLGLFCYRHTEYADELWWRFGYDADASRFLRATLGAVTLVVALALTKLIKAAPVAPLQTTPQTESEVEAIVRRCPRAHAWLALLGDKQLLFNDAHTAFIMYGMQGRSWITLGEPVGPDSEHAELAWRFRELCDRHSVRPVFYHVGQKNLPLYLELGLSLLKLGEEAHVQLSTFGLAGSKRRPLRHEVSRAEKGGCRFELVPAAAVPDLLPQFKTISDTWLSARNAKEKGFSLGFFNEAYLRRFPAAVIRIDDTPVAFANVLSGADKAELSVDMMRYLPECPPGTMTYLFTQLMLWGKEQEFQWFNLGNAPLSGLEDRQPSSLWNRLGGYVYLHGEHFYNFVGLRQFKEKFEPEWSPKYLASKGGLALPQVLKDVVSLIRM